MLDSSVLVAIMGIVFWCGQLTQQIFDLDKQANMSAIIASRVDRVEARQDMVLTTISQIDHRLERIEENQQKIMEQLSHELSHERH